MNTSWKRILLPICLVACARAAEWPPIPPEIWAIREDPAKGIKDAVVLEKRTVLKMGSIRRLLRVRILSEAGRKAVELPEFPKECCDFKGRTVYPDGRSVTFDKRQDFRRESVEFGDFSEKRTIVIPPGITGNCVVELRWNESFRMEGKNPFPARMGYSVSMPFGGPYLTLLEAIELPSSYNWSYHLSQGNTVKLEQTQEDDWKTFLGRNIPALECPLYFLSPAMDQAVFHTFYIPPFLVRYHPQWTNYFWHAVGLNIVRPRFEFGIQKKENYWSFQKKTIEKIQVKTPHAFAAELIPLIEGEILHASQLTHEEFGRWNKAQKVPGANDLEAICRTKTADGMGMMLLFYHLLVDAGFSPKVALVADREQRLFSPKIFNPWQFSTYMVALGEPGKGLAFFDPSERYAPLGLIHPHYQGVMGLLLDEKDGWNTNPLEMPVQPASFNRRHYEYTLDLAEEEDRFRLATRFSGYPEFLERRRYLASDQGEQNRSLKERMEKGLKGASITRAEVLDAANPKKNVTWKVEGTLEREAGRQRKIEPFPGMQLPLEIPESFPRERTLEIVMPYLQVHTARATFRVPRGFRLTPPAPMDVRNSLGHVSWTLKSEIKGEETVATLTLVIGVDSMFAPPKAYEELKAFLGWVEEACRRTVTLEKI